VRNARFLRDRFTSSISPVTCGTGRARTSHGTTQERLSQHDRQAKLLALLRREGTVRIATLAKVFDVTTETARRDLDELARSGALKRTYGGGASRSLIDEPGIGIRSRAHAAERGLIGTRRGRHGGCRAMR
jgi:predicted DNA-binding transcriptional regulator YafY